MSQNSIHFSNPLISKKEFIKKEIRKEYLIKNPCPPSNPVKKFFPKFGFIFLLHLYYIFNSFLIYREHILTLVHLYFV